MRRLLIAAAFMTLPIAVYADAVSPSLTLAPVNCDALNTGTMICVRNATTQSITKITCSGFWGSSDLSISRGIIHSGETTIVDFEASKCAKHIVVFLRDGHQYPYDGFDTKNNTILLVGDN